MRNKRQRAPGHIDSFDRSLVEVVGDYGVAGPVVGILADPAGTENAAVADFEETPFEVVCHTRLPMV